MNATSLTATSLTATSLTATSLTGRVALITGVSRRQGIAYATALRLAALGADLFVSGHPAHDSDQPWGGDDSEELLDSLRETGVRVERLDVDLADPDAPKNLMDAAVAAYGMVDILCCVHARSGGDGALLDCDAQMLDTHWAVNTRSTLLLTRWYTEQFDVGRSNADSGRVIWFTSGQSLGSMSHEIAYATAKAGLAGIAVSVADDLIDRRILLNVVNPGPVDTAYLGPELMPAEVRDPLLARMPLGRFGEPDDPARLVAWLVSDEGRWVVGQVINSEGGFRRAT